MIVVDAMNVIGCVPDGWWRDRPAALGRLVEAIAEHPWDDWLVVMVDGRAPTTGPLRAGTRGGIELRYAGHSAPDAADDAIVELVATDDAPASIRVVTSDARLVERVTAQGASVEGARTFRRRIEA